MPDRESYSADMVILIKGNIPIQTTTHWQRHYPNCCFRSCFLFISGLLNYNACEYSLSMGIFTCAFIWLKIRDLKGVTQGSYSRFQYSEYEHILVFAVVYVAASNRVIANIPNKTGLLAACKPTYCEQWRCSWKDKYSRWRLFRHSGRPAVQFPWLRGDGQSLCTRLRFVHVVLSALHLHEPAGHRALRDVQPAPKLGHAPRSNRHTEATPLSPVNFLQWHHFLWARHYHSLGRLFTYQLNIFSLSICRFAIKWK